MTRVYVIVEGATEESFVNGPFAEALSLRGVYATPIILGVPGHKGGNTKYVRVLKDVLAMLKQDQRSYCSTMIDYYGLGSGFPGTPPPHHLTTLQRVEHIERAVKSDVCTRIPNFWPDLRFLPYLSLHEYEALLFSDPEALARSIGQQHLAHRFREIREEFATPEDIDNNPQTAPSKRVVGLYASYSKVIDGALAASAVGTQRMREECPHFRAWLERLEALPEL